jgi:Zn-dependent protease with chaperone function
MTTCIRRIATKTRTWLLIAGLTALLIGIGALIGGVWLYVFVALAVAMNVGGYWFSDRLALQVSRAKRVEPGTRPNLEAMVQDLARRAELPAPRLHTIPSEQPNAFATGRNPRHAAVAVTEGLVQPRGSRAGGMCRRQPLTLHAAIFDSAMATIDGWTVNVALPAIERCGQDLADREW